MKKFLSRSVAAHVCMGAGILFIGFGISILSLGWGLASAGLACGIYGYLLGAE
ncbi:MAG: hypothetical protein VW948_06550 [Burkholderiaceae bacterium]|jgi:hypothetical protein